MSILYETLEPLSGSLDLEDERSNSYAVFRNQIPIENCHLSEDAAIEFFSLESFEPVFESPLPALNSCPPQEDQELELSSIFRASSGFKSPMLQLHKEIVDFYNFLSPTPEEEASRTAAVESVFDVIRYIWPHCRVEVFGSFKTGLYLPTSDIDVVILESKVKTPQMGLHALSRALSQRNMTKKKQVIAYARVPIIKFVEKQSGIAFDISFDVNNGPVAAEFIKDAVDKLPPLRPLCLILKVFLQQRELNEVYSGGIGSYALLAMLIAHLQMHWRGQDFQGYQTSVEHNLGILLVKFFDFYGRKLNTWDVGVSCKATGTFFSKRTKGFLRPDKKLLLSIEDPQDPDNDIGKNSYNYFQVRSAFGMAYSLLTDAKTIMSLGPNQSILGLIVRPDQSLLGRKGGLNGQLTFNSLLPGAGRTVGRQLGTDGDITCNYWELDDDEPLPRGQTMEENGIREPARKSPSKRKHKERHNQHTDHRNLSRENGGEESNRKKKRMR